jgi:uncharacterized membrane protein YsdA (DUF1294 family)/cold shock CspA family protein
MRKKGTMRSWNEQKAFGFIQPADGGTDVFVHISGMGNRNRKPELGQKVSYIMSSDKQGRPCAEQVLLPGDRLPRDSAKAGFTGSVIVAAIFISVVAFLTYATSLPVIVIWGCLTMSLVTFLVYAVDKSAAKRNARRTPENTLHMLALAGGWPGALIAQQALRHKSSKQPFRTVFWITVIVNCGALIWLCTPDGMQLLQEWGIDGFNMGNSATIEWAE